MPSDPDSRYDALYYQSGSERGTKYDRYLEEAPKNRTYFELAETISKLFALRRTLEIGCATGAIVSHLATFDVEAFGIDVSEFAVEHRLHPNVSLGSVTDLPFGDQEFDLVYSCHALEHLPQESKQQAFEEIARVCRGMQFHMMPIIESGPYVGDRFGHLLNLRSDPTHSLLYPRQWWIDQFQSTGFDAVDVNISVVHDNTHYELSDCQVVLSRNPVNEDFFRRVARHNHDAARALSLALNGRPGPGLNVHVARLRNSE